MCERDWPGSVTAGPHLLQ